MDFADVKSAVVAAEGAVDRARQRLLEARAVLAEAHVIQSRNRTLMIGEERDLMDDPPLAELGTDLQ